MSRICSYLAIRSPIMPRIISILLVSLLAWFQSRLSLQLELIALRHQVTVYKLSVPDLRSNLGCPKTPFFGQILCFWHIIIECQDCWFWAGHGGPKSGQGRWAVLDGLGQTCRSLTLGLSVLLVAQMATGVGVRSTSDCHHLAEEAVSNLLATIESEWQARSARGFQGNPGPPSRHVAKQSDIGFSSYRRRTPKDRHRCGQIDGREVPAKGSQSILVHVEGIPEQSCRAHRVV